MLYPVSSTFCFDRFSKNFDHVHVLQLQFSSAIVLKGFPLLLEQMFDLTNCSGRADFFHRFLFRTIKLIFVQSTSFLKLKSRCTWHCLLYSCCIIHVRGISFYFKIRNEHSQGFREDEGIKSCINEEISSCGSRYSFNSKSVLNCSRYINQFQKFL